MAKNKKIITILGLTAAAVIFMVMIFAMQQPPKQSESDSDILLPDTAAENVAVNNITEPPAITEAPDIEPNIIPPTEPEPPVNSITEINIPLTVIADKPKPPEFPETAFTGERTGDATLEDVEAHEALDPALKNPDVKPDIPPATVVPPKPTEQKPQGGSTNAKGEVYVEGFGWIKSSGDNIGESSGSDGDWNKQIGNMG